MPTIAVSDIFSPHIGNLYEAIDDKDLIQKNHLVLSELYSFDLILDDLDNPKGYMFSPYSDCTAMIVKLDNTYYLTGIDGCDGYRDDRGKIYQLNFDTTELSTILNKKKYYQCLN